MTVQMSVEIAQMPRVGVGVMVMRRHGTVREVLLGKRKSSDHAGTFCFPGGRLGPGEDPIKCGLREIKEQCGIDVEKVRFQFVAYVTTFLPKIYVHIGLQADYLIGEPRLLQPGNYEDWKWHPLGYQLPQPLFKTTELAFESLRSGENFFNHVK